MFTFALKPLPIALVGTPVAAVHDQQQLKQHLVPTHADGKPSSWELQLVMEFCEEVSLLRVITTVGCQQMLHCGHACHAQPGRGPHACSTSSVADGPTGLLALQQMVLALAQGIAFASAAVAA